VSVFLGKGLGGLKGIADRDEKFNATDAINPALPMRRFGLGATAPDCVLVSVEQAVLVTQLSYGNLSAKATSGILESGHLPEPFRAVSKI